MAIYFLSDIHLSAEASEITQAFSHTLQTLEESKPEAVFILGDLFNVWLGDSLCDEFSKQVAEMLKKLSQVCPVFFQRGNRDFLLGKTFCAQAGMVLLPEIFIFEYNELRLRLEHGDLLCTDDVGYQRMRTILHHQYFRRVAGRVPRWLAEKIAHWLRQQSKQRTAKKKNSMTDVNKKAVDDAMKNIDILIHGHTHRPAIHKEEEGKKRVVLGDWRPNGEILKLENGRFDLKLWKKET